MKNKSMHERTMRTIQEEKRITKKNSLRFRINTHLFRRLFIRYLLLYVLEEWTTGVRSTKWFYAKSTPETELAVCVRTLRDNHTNTRTHSQSEILALLVNHWWFIKRTFNWLRVEWKTAAVQRTKTKKNFTYCEYIVEVWEKKQVFVCNEAGTWSVKFPVIVWSAADRYIIVRNNVLRIFFIALPLSPKINIRNARSQLLARERDKKRVQSSSHVFSMNSHSNDLWTFAFGNFTLFAWIDKLLSTIHMERMCFAFFDDGARGARFPFHQTELSKKRRWTSAHAHTMPDFTQNTQSNINWQNLIKANYFIRHCDVYLFIYLYTHMGHW